MRHQKLIDKTNARLQLAAEQLHSYGLWAAAEGYAAMAEQMTRGSATLEWLAEYTKCSDYRDGAIELLDALEAVISTSTPSRSSRRNDLNRAAEKRARIPTIAELVRLIGPWTASREYKDAAYHSLGF